MADTKLIEGANFYVICPECGEAIPFKGVDIQYYQPIGAEMKYENYDEQKEAIDTDKTIGCPFCKESFKSKDGKFIINDF